MACATASKDIFTPASEKAYREAGSTAIGKRLMIEFVRNGDVSGDHIRNIKLWAKAVTSSPRFGAHMVGL